MFVVERKDIISVTLGLSVNSRGVWVEDSRGLSSMRGGYAGKRRIVQSSIILMALDFGIALDLREMVVLGFLIMCGNKSTWCNHHRCRLAVDMRLPCTNLHTYSPPTPPPIPNFLFTYVLVHFFPGVDKDA